MSCVGAISLSELWLYWSHIDGPTQLLATMYGRVLGVKILIFGTLLLLGITVVLPKIPAKEVTTSTWVWGASETVAVAGVMIIGFAVSGRIAHRRVLAVAAPP